MADLIANGMKSWAKSLNVTHYTHWFPTSDRRYSRKHDGFIEFGEDGMSLNAFSGKLLSTRNRMLLLSPTAVSVNTFEARGYTAWDVSSPAFVVDTTLLYPNNLHLYRRGAGLQDTSAQGSCSCGQSRNGCLPAFRQEHNTRIYELGLGTGIFPRRPGAL